VNDTALPSRMRGSCTLIDTVVSLKDQLSWNSPNPVLVRLKFASGLLAGSPGGPP
jgi:hypothetical protein